MIYSIKILVRSDIPDNDSWSHDLIHRHKKFLIAIMLAHFLMNPFINSLVGDVMSISVGVHLV